MIYAEETLATALKDMKPLLVKHWHEIAWRQDKIPLDPDYTRYQQLEILKYLRIYTARKESGELIGYALWIVTTLSHYKQTLCAANDIVYVDEAHRGGVGVRLLQFSETELKKLGVQVMSLHIKKVLDWSPLAGALGFEHTESNHHKWIGD